MNLFLSLVISGIGVQGVLLFWLKRQKIYQQIYELSPQQHQQKTKTPSFGGIGIIVTSWVGVVLFQLWTPKVVWVIGLMSIIGMLGFFDDWIALINDNNKGFSARAKLFLQIIISSVWLVGYIYLIAPLSVGTFIFYVFVMVGSINATNLSDGLDGLLSGLGMISLMGFMWLFSHMGSSIESKFALICMISLGCFLLYNRYPAKMFMGDTGSLAVGGLLSGLAIILQNPWVLISLGAVYIIETASVILQVISYKKRKKRIFLMSPLHHHFELLGWKEPIVVVFFWGLGLVFLWVFKQGYIQ